MSRNPIIQQILTGPAAHLNQHLAEKVVQPPKMKKVRKDCKQVVYIKTQLTYWCMDKGYLLIPEMQFNKLRKYRFDFAVMAGVTLEQVKAFDFDRSNMIAAIEYEGLNSDKSGHTTLTGYTKDTDKYNLAQSEGWKVLRFTVLNYKTVLQELEKMVG